MSKTNKLFQISFIIFTCIILVSLLDRVLGLVAGEMIYCGNLSKGVFIPLLILFQVLVVVNAFIYSKTKPLFYRIIPRTKNKSVNIYLYLLFSFIYISIIILLMLIVFLFIVLIVAMLMPILDGILPETILMPLAFMFGSIWHLTMQMLNPMFWLGILVSIFIIYLSLLVNLLIRYLKNDSIKKNTLSVSYYISSGITLFISLGLFIYAFINVVILKDTSATGYEYSYHVVSLLYFDKVMVFAFVLFIITLILDIIFKCKFKKNIKIPNE